VVGSLAFPLITGTPLTSEIKGVFIRPLTLPSAFTIPANVRLEWFTVALTVAGVCAAFVFRSRSRESVAEWSGWTHATMAALAVWLLGLGVTVFAYPTWVVAKWLPAIVLLPALAFCSQSPESVRLALRATVVLATLQILVVYPVAGSQVGWGTVAMAVPCCIALAAGVDHSRAWREANLFIRGGAAVFLSVAFVIAIGQWPPTIWKGYLDSQSMGLPGTGLIRIDPTYDAGLKQVVQSLQAQCDTFYGVPNQNSFYIFSGLPAVTGIVANAGISGLTNQQRAQIIDALQQANDANKRVCILRDTSQVIALPPGPLTDVLNQYSSVVATVGSYTISRHG
jgi:hypothetical protein